MCGAAGMSPTTPVGRFQPPPVATDPIQRLGARAVSSRRRNERPGRRSGHSKRRPCLPTARGEVDFAADPIKRRMSVRVPKQNRRLNERGAADGG